MVRVFFLTLVLSSGITLRAQQITVQPDDPAFISKYADFNFNGKFAAIISSDATNNYFLLDFSKLLTRFERVYFMNLSFLSPELINIDPDVSKNRVCFMANKKYLEPDIFKQFEGVKKNVDNISASWTDEKKFAWLKANDKYK